MMAWAEYADVILNNNSENEGVAPVIFPHWFHRIRFQCSVCHVELGIKMRAGSTGIRMEQLMDGRYCGACHDGLLTGAKVDVFLQQFESPEQKRR
jgi:c(7)-type cytochrome triheme protein